MADRPDLDEFLGALSGFVSKKNSLPQDPSYTRFLEIFCRSVGSSEGHLLQYVDGQGLRSVVSCGISKEFDKQYNQAVSAVKNGELSPIDRAFRDQQVGAVVELKREAGVPPWFFDFMEKFRFKALVALPLIGQTRPVGVLCAYYRDVCLFDQGTMDRLMTIGRMVGTAIENSMSGGGEPGAPSDSSLDAYLTLLSTNTLTENHVFEALTKVAAKALAPSGLLCGPLRMAADQLMITVANGAGVSPAIVSHRLAVPPLLAQPLLLGRLGLRQSPVTVDQLGAFRPLVAGRAVATLCQPIIWKKQPQAGIIAWRNEQNPFTSADELQLARLSAISALVLRSL